MKQFEKHNYKTAEEAANSNKCPDEFDVKMCEYCITDGCLAHWESEVDE